MRWIEMLDLPVQPRMRLACRVQKFGGEQMSRLMISAATATLFLLGATNIAAAQDDAGEIPQPGEVMQQGDQASPESGAMDRQRGDRMGGQQRSEERRAGIAVRAPESAQRT